ncbi:pentapeptide repeat-containing protein [Chitinibacter sp. ZOR0017]|uniref:pentapeptide repeat-containing protein n=1 Tax=Chitinibacter sp. ZOR0017 TaxID=1339254 RepID=UPI0009DFCC75
MSQAPITPRLFVNEHFTDRLLKPASWSEHAYRHCEFELISGEGAQIDSIFYACVFKQCDWYWALFNMAVFVQVRFENCVFRGAAFADCRFVECQFINCQFIPDNLGAPCRFNDSEFFACTQNNSHGLPSSLCTIQSKTAGA